MINFKVIAHRGNSGEAPENSLTAFQQAVNLHVDYIECDIQLTKDRIPIVFHDHTTERIFSNLEVREINDLNWSEIKQLDAGSWFDKKYNSQRILSLEEFLSIPKKKTGSMIEIKDETVRDQESLKIICNVLKKIPLNSTLLGSLNPKINMWLHDELPHQSLVAIVDQEKDLEIFLHETASTTFALRHTLATPECILSLQNKGKEVCAWTIDEIDIAKKLIQDGIEGIITNHPKKMLALRQTLMGK